MDHATAAGLVPKQAAGTSMPDPVRQAHETIRTYLDTLPWARGRCAWCRVDQDRVTECGHIEQGTLPGYPLLICREHAAHDLTLARIEAHERGEGFEPDIRWRDRR